MFYNPSPPRLRNYFYGAPQVHFYGAHGPTHLFVLLHGFSGNPSHVEALGEAIARRFGSSALLMRPSCNQNTASLDGIDQCACRVLRELRRLVADTASLRTLSLVGYSMGGLVARYLSGALLLEELPFLGLSPLNLVTFATPHLGAERSGNGPTRFYLDHLGGRSLAQMNLSDETKLLALMAHPRSAFFRGLAARRLCQRPDGPLCRLPLGLHRTVGGWRIRTSSGWGGAQAVPARRLVSKQCRSDRVAMVLPSCGEPMQRASRAGCRACNHDGGTRLHRAMR